MRINTVFGPAGRDSTIVESSLQIGLFMQNKANFRKSQVGVSPLITKDYENKSNWTLGENKPNRRPLAGNPKHEARNPKQIGLSLCSLRLNRKCKTRPTSDVALPKIRSLRVSTVEVVSLECTIDDYGKVFAG